MTTNNYNTWSNKSNINHYKHLHSYTTAKQSFIFQLREASRGFLNCATRGWRINQFGFENSQVLFSSLTMGGKLPWQAVFSLGVQNNEF